MSLSKQKGFTIIEVLIVLAIAGLILLVVFLAVPALQRNSRNTAIRNDAAAALGGVSEFVTNNNGTLPTTINVDAATGVATVSGGGTTTSNTFNVRAGTAVSVGTSAPSATGTIVIGVNKTCNGNTFAGGNNNRAVAAVFLVESGNGTPSQCVNS